MRDGYNYKGIVSLVTVKHTDGFLSDFFTSEVHRMLHVRYDNHFSKKKFRKTNQKHITSNTI